jgi:hypothetical protein
MRRFSLASLAAAAMTALLLTSAAPASAGTLDQQQTSQNSSIGLSSSQSPAQTFTAGISGRLDRVDLWLEKSATLPSPVTVEIRNTSAAEPGNTVLAAASVPDSAIGLSPGSFVAITFAAPPPVAVGTQYAIVAYNSANVARWRYQNTGNPYSRGAAFVSGDDLPPDMGFSEIPGADMAFKTYVLTPQPTGKPTATCKGKPATKVGTDGPDEIVGTDERDVIAALDGNDKVSGLKGKDLICGGKNKDTLKGGKGKDKLLGQKGRDKLRGGGGEDTCKGGKGDDSASKCEVEKSI